MSSRGLFVLPALCLLQLCLAQHQHFYRWSNPIENLGQGDRRRQVPPPGYHPEFGTCGSGTTCENACGGNWVTCKASTELSLFCYNKVDLNQTCCGNGSGRACDNGYYCAWNTFGGKVWCCKNGQSREECGVDPCPDGGCTSPDTNSTTTVVTSTVYTPTLTTTTTQVDETTTTTTQVGGTTTTTTQTGGTTTTTTVVGGSGTTTTTTKTVTSPGPGEIVTVTVTSVSVQVKTDTVTVTVPGGSITVTAYSTVSVTITTNEDCPTPCSWPTKPTKPDWHHEPSSTSCTDPPDQNYTPGHPEGPGYGHPSTQGPKLVVGPTDPTVGPTTNLTIPSSSKPAVITSGAGNLAVSSLALVLVMVGMLL